MKTTMIIAISILLLGCRAGKTVTERVVRETDSAAVWELRDSLQRKVTEIALLKTDLKRVREENMTLRTEGMSYEIKYNTAVPIDTTTGKPPIMSERITTHLSRYEKSVADVEHQQKEWSLERESLTRKNSSLQLSVDKMTRENRELKEKPAPSYPFRLKLLPLVVMLGILLAAWRLLRGK